MLYHNLSMSQEFESRREEMDARFPGLTWDETTPESVVRIVEQSLRLKMFNPSEDPSQSTRLKWTRDTWRQQGATVVYHTGAYDLMHRNHVASFVHAKRIGSAFHYDQHFADQTGFEWKDLSPEQQNSFFTKVCIEGKVRLIESVGGNMWVKHKKSGQSHKGGSIRPILDWVTRASSVSSVYFSPDGVHTIPSVDAVTIHDPKDPRLKDGPHAGYLELADYLRPDVWAVYCENDDIIEAYRTTHKTTLGGIALILLEDHAFFDDKLLNDTLKTTAIVRRINESVQDSQK